MSSTKVDDAAAKVRRGCEVLRESAQRLERAARRSSSHGLRAVRPCAVETKAQMRWAIGP